MGRKPRGIIAQQDPQLPSGYNARSIDFMMQIIPTKPLDKEDVPEMERRFENYLRLCIEYDQKVSNQAAYTAIGIDKDEVYNWTHRDSNVRRCEFVKKVQSICRMYREKLMMDSRVNPAVGIFWQKNYDGMKDVQDVIITPNNPLGDEKSAAELKDKYIESTYGLIDQKDDPQ